MIVRDDYEDDAAPAGGVRTRGRSGAGFVTGMILSAALSAGIALLYAPEPGTKTRKKVRRRLDVLQKEARRSRPARAAEHQIRMLQRKLDERRHAEQRARRRAALIAAVVGAGVGVLLAPEAGRTTRRRLGDSARRAGDAAARLRGREGVDAGKNGDWREPSRPVRSVQELGRDASDVF